MTNDEIEIASQIFGRQYRGQAPTKEERAFLQGLLDRMNESERAGTIAAILKIMLKEN